MLRHSDLHAAARTAGRLALAAGCIVLAPGCAGETPCEVTVGRHRLRLVVPKGWEHLDHGRQQLFRKGEVELVLEDWGPATPEGLATELRQAQGLWLAGRRGDAFARVRELHGPPLQLLPSQARADFWRPWTNATYAPEAADSAAVGRAFGALLELTGDLSEVSLAQLTEHVVSQAHDAGRREIARTEQRSIHGHTWSVVETWDRASHLYPRRLACLQDRGYLLVLDTQRGLIEQIGPAFEQLLASIEVLPGG